MIPIIFYILMVIAHFGQYVLGDHAYYAIGLPVLPFFGLMIAQGCRLTKDPFEYFMRLVVVAMVSEVFYNILMGSPCNDVICLLIGLSVIFIISREVKVSWKFFIYPVMLYLFNALSFKLAYVCFWVFIADIVLDFVDIKIPKVFKKSHFNYLIYPVHLILLLAIKKFM